MSNAIQFTPGSKVVFVAGGYEGGRERVGVVLGTKDDDVVLCMLDDDNLSAESHLESYGIKLLTSEINKGRIQGSLKETRFIPYKGAAPKGLTISEPTPVAIAKANVVESLRWVAQEARAVKLAGVALPAGSRLREALSGLDTAFAKLQAFETAGIV